MHPRYWRSLQQSLRAMRAAASIRSAQSRASAQGRRPVDFAALVAAGAVAFSDDGNTVENARVLRDAALLAREVPGVFISHAEDEDLKGDAVMSAGACRRRTRRSRCAEACRRRHRRARSAHRHGHRQGVAHRAPLDRGALELMRWARAGGATCHLRGDAASSTADRRNRARARRRAERSIRRCERRTMPRRCAPASATARSTCLQPITRRTPQQEKVRRSAHRSGWLYRSRDCTRRIRARAARPRCSVDSSHCSRRNPARILGIEGGTLRKGSRADVTIFADRPLGRRSHRRLHQKARARRLRDAPCRAARSPRSSAANCAGSLARDRGLRDRP